MTTLTTLRAAAEFFESYSVGAMSRNNAEQLAAELLPELTALIASLEAQTQEPQPPFGSIRKAAMAVYKPPFIYQYGYIYDSQNLMVADNGGLGKEDPGVEGAVAARVRGWGKLGYLPNGAELQDEIGQMMADALNALYTPAQPVEQPSNQLSGNSGVLPVEQPADLIPQDALFVDGQMGAHVTRVSVEQPKDVPENGFRNMQSAIESDRSYLHGLQAGYTLGHLGDEDGFRKSESAYKLAIEQAIRSKQA